MHGSEGESAAPAGGESRRPNPEAIAWYVEEAQPLLEDQQRRAESLRTRGGQVAGFGAAVLALIGGNVTELLSALDGFSGVFIGVALVAAACCLGAAVSMAVWGALRPKAFAAISGREVAIYKSQRFLTESRLWRVHVRSLHALDDAISDAEAAEDTAANAVEWALFIFLAGLGFALAAIAMLIVESI
jgi:hypothetical protein